jgi:nucleoside 2-deoxyribosyltransferase
MIKVYVGGSLSNLRVPQVARALRTAGFDVFDDWAASHPEADNHWRDYEKARGRSYREALNGEAAKNTFSFDLFHLDDSDVFVMVMPCGKSAWAEMGYMVGCGKPTFVLMEQEPERWDLMLAFASDVAHTVDELIDQIRFHTDRRMLSLHVPRGEA